MVISFVNNKGGVLKTTMATNVAASILKLKPLKRVVILDLDGQGNVSATFGQHPERLKDTLIDILRKEKTIDDCILNVYNHLDILPCNFELSFVDIDVATHAFYKKNKNDTNSSEGTYGIDDIKKVIKDLDKIYDYVIIDTPPAMATIVSIALSLSKLVVIPFEPDQYSILGLMRIVDTINDFKLKNSDLETLVVPTKVNLRTRLHFDVISLIKKKLQKRYIKLSKSYISLTTKSAAAVGYEKVPISLLMQKTKYHDEYAAVAKEILDYER